MSTKGIEGAQVIQAKGQIEGSCSDRFAAVREAFAYNLGSGQDIGASVAIAVDGGSLSFIDLDARMAIGYVPNRWITGPFEQHRSANIVRAAYQSLHEG